MGASLLPSCQNCTYFFADPHPDGTCSHREQPASNVYADEWCSYHSSTHNPAQCCEEPGCCDRTSSQSNPRSTK